MRVLSFFCRACAAIAILSCAFGPMVAGQGSPERESESSRIVAAAASSTLAAKGVPIAHRDLKKMSHKKTYKGNSKDFHNMTTYKKTLHRRDTAAELGPHWFDAVNEICFLILVSLFSSSGMNKGHSMMGSMWKGMSYKGKDLFVMKGNKGISVWPRIPTAPPSPPPQDRRLQAALTFLDQQTNQVTGLVKSYFEETANNTYVYDQALMTLAWLVMDEPMKARKALTALYDLDRVRGGFYQRYNTITADAIFSNPERDLKTGNNAYVLQAIDLYYDITGDSRFQGLARRAADNLLQLQNVTDGGLQIDLERSLVKSCENNLAAYPALESYARLTCDSKYTKAANALKEFLLSECWDGTRRFNRGKDDPTEVTDVNALGGPCAGAKLPLRYVSPPLDC